MYGRLQLNAFKSEFVNPKTQEKRVQYVCEGVETDLFLNLRDWKIIFHPNDDDGKSRVVLVPRRMDESDD